MISKAQALDIVLNKIISHVEETNCKDDDIQTLTQIALVLEMDPTNIKAQRDIEHQREIERRQQEQRGRDAMQALNGFSPSYPYGPDGPPNSIYGSTGDYGSDYKW